VKALITGITGFAGSHLAEALLAAGDQVLGLTRQDNWPANLPAKLATTVPLLKWDITQPVTPELQAAVAEWKPDCCYHLAAISIPADCGTTTPTPAALACNVAGTQHVVDLVITLPQVPRFLLTSSNHVYAPVDAANPVVSETAPVNPESAYGKTKLAAESIVLQAVQSQQLEACIARSFQHTGPRQQARLMVPEWACQFARETKTVRVQTLDSYLDLSDVRDVVRAYHAIMLQGMQQGTTGALFNVGSGTAVRSGDVCELFQQRVSQRRQIEELYPGQRQQPIANISQLQKVTDWQPTIKLAQTIDDTLSYWKAQFTSND
jgi:GDP-4-dehydro-6-deoxy-D-mannose reductase